MIKSQKGYRAKNYAAEIDNYLNLNKVDNIMIGPLIDKNGKVRGVL
jgi:hypothetical protein